MSVFKGSEQRITYAVQEPGNNHLLGPYQYLSVAKAKAKEVEGIVVNIIHPLAEWNVVENEEREICYKCHRKLHNPTAIECPSCVMKREDKLAAEMLAELGNTFGRGRYKDIAAQLVRQHRTIQQNLGSFILQLLHTFACQDEKGTRHDLPKLEMEDTDEAEMEAFRTTIRMTLRRWNLEVDEEEFPNEYWNLEIPEYGRCWDLRNAGLVHLCRLFVSFWHTLLDMPGNVGNLPYV